MLLSQISGDFKNKNAAGPVTVPYKFLIYFSIPAKLYE